MTSLLDVLAVVVHDDLSIDVMSQLGCTSKQFNAAARSAVGKKKTIDRAKEVFEFIQKKPTYEQKTNVIDMMPLPVLENALAYPVVRHLGGDNTFTFDETIIKFSIDIGIQFPDVHGFANAGFAKTFDFVENVTFYDFYEEKLNHALTMATKAFDLFAAKHVYDFRESFSGTVVSYTWIARDVSFVKLDFMNKTVVPYNKITLRRSKPAPKHLTEMAPVPFDKTIVQDILKTMLKFLPV